MTRLCVFILAAIISFVQVNSQPERYIGNLKVKYFTDVKLNCDHMDLNISDQNVKLLRWIFPDGSLVDSDTYLNPRLYKLSGINDTSSLSGQRLKGYTLELFEIGDSVFGYYTCLVVLKPPSGGTSGSDESIIAIRWGLNVNGADFSELIDTYKENAIIGGIAAGVVLFLIAAGCLIWYRCFSDDNRYSDDAIKGEGHIEIAGNGMEMHENISYVTEKDEKHLASRQTGERTEMDAVNF